MFSFFDTIIPHPAPAFNIFLKRKFPSKAKLGNFHYNYRNQISLESSSTVSSKIFIASRTVSGLVRSTPAILSSSSG